MHPWTIEASSPDEGTVGRNGGSFRVLKPIATWSLGAKISAVLGPQDFRKVYGRGIGAALAARTARSVAASYRRADQRSGGNGASVVWEPDDTPDIS